MKAVYYDWGGLNRWLFHLINDVHAGWLDQLMLLGTALGNHNNFPFYLALASVVGVWLNRRTNSYHANEWLIALAVFALAYCAEFWIIDWIKEWADFPRPPRVLPPDTVHIVGRAEYLHSFPSGHSAFAMLVTASFWPVSKGWWRVALVMFSLWIGLSRISLGAHFPADVMGGFMLSLILILMIRFLVKRLAGPSVKKVMG